MIITTGSQGEPMSSLARMASGTHKQLKAQPGDTVILSSKFIPGNEKAIAGIINKLFRRGADVIHEKISEIHVSGHAFREELKLMIQLTRPRYFIPIHGEYRHLLLHTPPGPGKWASKEKTPFWRKNGNVVRLADGKGWVQGTVATGRILIDGKGIGDVGRSVLKERRVLSEDGLVAVNLVFDEETGHHFVGAGAGVQGIRLSHGNRAPFAGRPVRDPGDRGRRGARNPQPDRAHPHPASKRVAPVFLFRHPAASGHSSLYHGNLAAGRPCDRSTKIRI